MEKNKKIILIAIGVLILSLVIITVLFFGGSKKEVITDEHFSEILLKHGFEIIDAKEMIDNAEAEVVKVAQKEEIIIEFFVLSTEDHAIELYEKYEKLFKVTNDGTSETDKGRNWNKYSQISSEMYSVSSRIDNTYIYVNVNYAYEEEVSNILIELGY